MAVRTQKGSLLPEGAVKLTKEEALEIQKKFIKNWPSEFEVFSIKYATHICAASTLVCGTLASNYFRNVFQVPSRIFPFLYAPSVVLPTLGSLIMTDRLLTDKILLMTMDCPVCVQLKFTAFQLYNSALSPAILSFLIYHNFGTSAKALNSYDSPFLEGISWKKISNIIKKESFRFQLIGFIQLGVSFFLPYLQSRQLENVTNKDRQKNYSEEIPSDMFV